MLSYINYIIDLFKATEYVYHIRRGLLSGHRCFLIAQGQYMVEAWKYGQISRPNNVYGVILLYMLSKNNRVPFQVLEPNIKVCL